MIKINNGEIWYSLLVNIQDVHIIISTSILCCNSAGLSHRRSTFRHVVKNKLVIAKTRIFFRLKFPVMLITAEFRQVLAFQQKLATL